MSGILAGNYIDFAKATRELKLEGKKRKAKGNSAKFSDMEADQVQAKKTKFKVISKSKVDGINIIELEEL